MKSAVHAPPPRPSPRKSQSAVCGRPSVYLQRALAIIDSGRGRVIDGLRRRRRNGRWSTTPPGVPVVENCGPRGGGRVGKFSSFPARKNFINCPSCLFFFFFFPSSRNNRNVSVSPRPHLTIDDFARAMFFRRGRPAPGGWFSAHRRTVPFSRGIFRCPENDFFEIENNNCNLGRRPRHPYRVRVLTDKNVAG